MDDYLSKEVFNKDLIQVFRKLIDDDLDGFLSFCVYTKNLTPIKNVIANIRIYQFSKDNQNRE